ncbi:MAG: EF-P lysine aminoacylase EpmA [Salinisphaera sp.]|jgi:lysyl-tRNA synthetase class 2|nr:EF-P lysine aminoacylase EpmA [Salinisphaera sp.]
MAPAAVDDWRPGADRATLIWRAQLLAALRRFMAERSRVEVDTPVISSAAPAERALDCLTVVDGGYLVPSPEHALKRLLAAGHGSLYQLGHVFRAGEIGRWHNPEFTMLEWYREHADLAAMLVETDELLQAVGVPTASAPQRYREAFGKITGLDPLIATLEELAAYATTTGIAPVNHADDEHNRMFWLDLIMSLAVQPTLGLEAPVMITHFPIDDAVLIASDPDDERLGLRFECYWQGVELANGAVELRDAQVAEQRMQREFAIKQLRGVQPPPIDTRLLSALAAGLPPCAGVALGVDRLLALLVGASNLDQVLPFAWPRR